MYLLVPVWSVDVFLYVHYLCVVLEAKARCLLQSLSTSLIQFNWLAGELQEAPRASQTSAAVSNFLYGCQFPNPGCNTCVARTFLAELSPTPYISLIWTTSETE